MLPDPLRRYLEEVESSVRSLQGVYVERYQEEILTIDRVNLRIRVRFSDGFLLELNEAMGNAATQFLPLIKSLYL